jgi:hypothetical protein
MAQVQAEMDKETDPAAERVQALARRWKELVQEFTGGDPGITKSLGRMYQEEATVHGMDAGNMRGLMGYVQKAWAAGGKAE